MNKHTETARQNEPDLVVMFDLGGVLVQLQDFAETAKWGAHLMGEEQFEHLWRHSPHPARFERGLIEPLEFATLVCDEYQIAAEPATLLRHFASIVMTPFPETYQLLQAARKIGRLACLSNTNLTHWQKVIDETRILDYFDLLLPSFHLGLLKPEAAIYEAAIKKCVTSPENIVFFDDKMENVAAAAGAGIRAHQASGAAEALHILLDHRRPQATCKHV